MSPFSLFFLIPVYFLGAALLDLASKAGLWSAAFAGLTLWWLGVEYCVVAFRQRQQRKWLRSQGRPYERVRAMPWAFGQGVRRGLVVWTFTALLLWVDSTGMRARDLTALGTGLAGAALVFPLLFGMFSSLHSASRVGPDPLPPGPMTLASATQDLTRTVKLAAIVGVAIVGGLVALFVLPMIPVLLIRLF